VITGGRGPNVPHSPERGGPSQTKKRSLGDVATPEYRQADASRRAGRLVSTSHSVVGRPSGSTVSVETRELSGAWDAGSQGGQGDIARCAMALVKGQTCRLNGPVPQTCGLGSSERHECRGGGCRGPIHAHPTSKVTFYPAFEKNDTGTWRKSATCWSRLDPILFMPFSLASRRLTSSGTFHDRKSLGSVYTLQRKR
jgi:hypothetical protein